MEARRLDNQKYPAIVDSLGERKAHTIRNSQKNWPVGISPFAISAAGPADRAGRGNTGLFRGPAFRASVQSKRRPAGGDAVSRNQEFHPESIDLFRGKRIRIFPHDDADGESYRSALAWGEQLKQLGCEVDFFTFEDVGAKDLNDCTKLSPEFSIHLIRF
jgi:hypothetical protein